MLKNILLFLLLLLLQCTFVENFEKIITENDKSPLIGNCDTICNNSGNCNITLQVPANSAVKFFISSSPMKDGDLIAVETKNITAFTKQMQNNKFWSFGNAKITILSSPTDKDFLFNITYIYVDLPTKNIQKTTGDYFDLSTPIIKLNGKGSVTVDYYALPSIPKNEMPDVSDVFVFENQPTNEDLIGPLEKSLTERIRSTNNQLMIVNMNWNQKSLNKVYILANEYEDVKKYWHYTVRFTENGYKLTARLIGSLQLENALTYICVDCQELFLTRIQFLQISTDGGVEFQGMTPTNKMEPKLVYKYNVLPKNQLPQQFPTNVLTVRLKESTVNLTLTTAVVDDAWNTIRDKRIAKILNPSDWKLSNNSHYDYKFVKNENDTHTYSMDVDLSSAKLVNNDDKIHIEIGSNKNNNKTEHVFTKNNVMPKHINTSGDSLHISYSGGRLSSGALNVQMLMQSSATNMTWIMSVSVLFISLLFM